MIAIMGSGVAMDSVVIVPESGAMESGIGVMDCKVQNPGAIKNPEPGSATAGAIALKRRPRSAYQSSAAARF